MSSPFINPIPFTRGYRVVFAREIDLLVIEHLDSASGEWLAERMFPCSSEAEALGIAMTFSAQLSGRYDVNELVALMSNRSVHLPGDLSISMIEVSDGTYLAIVETHKPDGTISVASSRGDARNFFEAYGWALTEARLELRRNTED